MTFRGPKPLLDRFRARVAAGGWSEVIRQLVAWYLREPGAKLPDRPPRATEEAPDSERAA